MDGTVIFIYIVPYFLALLLAHYVAMSLSHRFRHKEQKLPRLLSYSLILLGGFSTIAISVAIAAGISRLMPTQELILFLGLTLIVPLITGILIVQISRIESLQKTHSKVPTMMRCLTIGAFHAVWLLPVLALFYTFAWLKFR
jgi:hypothetical protein